MDNSKQNIAVLYDRPGAPAPTLICATCYALQGYTPLAQRIYHTDLGCDQNCDNCGRLLPMREGPYAR